MEGVRSFRDLDAWKVAMELADACYSVAKRLPSDERFGLGAQLRRASVSVPSNIAEGFATHADGILRRHLMISLGSLAETDTLLELIRRNRFAEEEDLSTARGHLIRTRQLLFGLHRSVRARLLKKVAKAIVSSLALMFLAFRLLGS